MFIRALSCVESLLNTLQHVKLSRIGQIISFTYFHTFYCTSQGQIESCMCQNQAAATRIHVLRRLHCLLLVASNISYFTWAFSQATAQDKLGFWSWIWTYISWIRTLLSFLDTRCASSSLMIVVAFASCLAYVKSRLIWAAVGSISSRGGGVGGDLGTYFARSFLHI